MSDEDEIWAIHQQWLNAERSGSISAVLEMCSDDVLWLVPGTGAIRGKTAVKEWLGRQPNGLIETLEISRVEIRVSGRLAVKTADFRTKLRPPGQPPTSEVCGTHLWTLRKEQDSGRWLVTNVCWSISNEPDWIEP